MVRLLKFNQIYAGTYQRSGDDDVFGDVLDGLLEDPSDPVRDLQVALEVGEDPHQILDARVAGNVEIVLE
jgi:hypothetical protein